MRPAGRRFDWIVTGLAALLPAIVFFEAATSLTEQDAASGGPMRNAALFPEAVAWILMAPIAANVLRLVREGRSGQTLEGGEEVGSAPLTGLALLSAGLFVVYLLALPRLGYYAATPVLLLALTRLYGARWLPALLAALGLTLAVAFVFEGLLDVVLPLGPFAFTLFG